MLEKYKIIFWDFDGVLMNSNAVRDIGFEKVLASYPKHQVDELMAFHQANGGLSRYVKFRYFYEEVLKQEVTEEQIQEMAASFSVIMKSLLVNPDLLIQDSLEFVKQQFEQKIPMHIVSGSDQTELRFLCKELNIEHYFLSIHGSPTAKKILVKNVIEENNYLKENIVLIGDSINDLEAAKENEITFCGYNNPSLKSLELYQEKLAN
jgi:phosphoglycolate phosphatase-like HAD superfamily hydrolase